MLLLEHLQNISRAIRELDIHWDYEQPSWRATAKRKLRNTTKGNFGDLEARQETRSMRAHSWSASYGNYFTSDENILLELKNKFHEQFEQAKAQVNKLSYADLLLRLREALSDNLELRKRIKQDLMHILVDEYQDTSPIQEQIIALIAENKDHT